MYVNMSIMWTEVLNWARFHKHFREPKVTRVFCTSVVVKLWCNDIWYNRSVELNTHSNKCPGSSTSHKLVIWPKPRAAFTETASLSHCVIRTDWGMNKYIETISFIHSIYTNIVHGWCFSWLLSDFESACLHLVHKCHSCELCFSLRLSKPADVWWFLFCAFCW